MPSFALESIRDTRIGTSAQNLDYRYPQTILPLAIRLNGHYVNRMKRPTIFISSTIYDFRDLRGALKDYLELRGCKVLAPDHNDFNKDLEPHSYEACIKAIESADVFLLLIGSRVGGLKDTNDRVSITHAEYKRAYELAGEGRIRLLSFVRTEVFNHRESVKDMQRYLTKAAESERESTFDLSSAPTKFMTDAGTITRFIEEVSRNAETSAASKGQGEFPKANRLHQFSTFPDIRAQLDILWSKPINYC